MRKYWGKYRGMVIANEDPERRGRIMVQVPDVTGLTPGTWAMPCVPFTGKQSGMWCVPQVGAGVWVEYEQGDPDFPIWTGGWWPSAAEVPPLAQAAIPLVPNVVLQTGGGTMLVLSDNPAVGITIKSSIGPSIVMNAAGILISDGAGGTIALVKGVVSINNIGLVVK